MQMHRIRVFFCWLGEDAIIVIRAVTFSNLLRAKMPTNKPQCKFNAAASTRLHCTTVKHVNETHSRDECDLFLLICWLISKWFKCIFDAGNNCFSTLIMLSEENIRISKSRFHRFVTNYEWDLSGFSGWFHRITILYGRSKHDENTE